MAVISSCIVILIYEIYICDYKGCYQSFSIVQRLQVHLKKHAGIREYVCPFEGCNAAFYEKGNLKTHERMHTGEKPYFCNILGCQMSFSTMVHLKSHVKKSHSQRITNGLDESTPK